MPHWWDAKASPLFHLHPLMSAQQERKQNSEPGGEDEMRGRSALSEWLGTDTKEAEGGDNPGRVYSQP